MALLEKKWCLGNVVLPLEQHTCDLVDLKNGVVGDDENCPFLLLPLKSTGQTEWLDRHLKQRCRWWKRSGRYQPLMQELIDALPGSSKKQKYAGLTSRVVVPIEVRGKTILVLNNRNAPALAFREGEKNLRAASGQIGLSDVFGLLIPKAKVRFFPGHNDFPRED